jgi:uncharacterized membrane protein YhaH (DUF805 family)
MFDRNRPDRDDRRPRRFGFLQGRSSRLEYWAGIGVVVLVMVGAAVMHGRLGSALAAPLLFLMVRRLHDAGRTGWWAAAIEFGPIFLALLLVRPIGAPAAVAVAGFLTIAGLIVLGWLPEDGDNRFGPARRAGQTGKAGQEDLSEVFG